MIRYSQGNDSVALEKALIDFLTEKNKASGAYGGVI